MTEIVTGSSTEGETGEATPQGVVSTAPQSVEEAEAIWQKRMSGKDKAHAAEVNELRRQLDAKAAAQAAEAAASETPEQARIRELETRLAMADRERAVEVRKARFPNAADILGDDIATADEARLAALEARLADEGTPAPRMDPNAAPKGGPVPPKSLDSMTKDELLQALEGLSPAYRSYLDQIR